MIAGADAAAGGRLTWVLGEVHPSIVTLRYATWMEFHDDADTVRAAMRHDVHGAKVWMAETGEIGGTVTRLCNVLSSPGDLRFVFARDSCGYDPGATVTLGECDLVRSSAGLRVRRRDGTFERGLLEVVGDLIGTTASNCFDLVPSGAHVPRVTIDDLVVSRETWRLAATEPPFAEHRRRERTLPAGEGVGGEPRPATARVLQVHRRAQADLRGPDQPRIDRPDLPVAAPRPPEGRRRRDGDRRRDAARPGPGWLTDARGQRYTAEAAHGGGRPENG